MADLKRVEALITTHPDFPLPGILFRDIFPVFRDPVATELIFTNLVFHLTSTYHKIDVVVGLDSRGFLFGPIIALRLGASFVPIRKAGKLPGKKETVTYAKEYGADSFEIQSDAILPGQTVVIVDDLLATGGTMFAACSLVRKLGGQVIECMVVVELAELNGSQRLDVPTYSMLKY
eukprot:Opistho-2@51029